MAKLGRYDILEEIGSGGFATVYKAHDARLNRVVALKVLHPGWSKDYNFVRRFQQEAKTVANLRHPNIVVIYDVGNEERQLYLAMEYLKGEDLQIWLTQQKSPISLETTLSVLRPLASALDYAHNKGIIHRDIKPSNMVRDVTDQTVRMVLTDFGLVKMMENSTALTTTNQMLGSPEYMAPEQVDPNRMQEIGPHTDLYAFGIVAYQMLAGRVPFPGLTISTLNAHANLPIPEPQQFNPDLSSEVWTVLKKMLAKKSADRYPSALTFVDALQATLDSATQTQAAQAKLLTLYAQLQQAQTDGDWIGVLTLVGQIEMLQPGYKDVDAIKAEASRQLQAPKVQSFAAPSVVETSVASSKPQKQPVRSKTTPPLQPKPTPKTKPPAEKSGVPNYMWIVGGVVGIGIIILAIWVIAGGTDSPEPGIGATLEVAREATLDAEQVAAEIEKESLDVTATTEAENEVFEIEPTETTMPTRTPTPEPVLPPNNPDLGSSWVRPVDEMKMVFVPGGSFMMGSDPDADPNAQENEQPQHEVTLDGFWIDQTEVTNMQFAQFVADTKYTTTAEVQGNGIVFIDTESNWEGVNGADWQHPTGPDSSLDGLDKHPVVMVSWDDAVAYCEWAGGQLPSEAQWEYAARGDDGRLYPWGNYIENNKVNFCDTNCPTDWKDETFDDGYAYTAPVGSYPVGASWVDAFDMAGNVFEWTQDWYADDYYANMPKDNPTGSESGDVKVLRGGRWFDSAPDVRTAFRINDTPSARDISIGFRCVSPGD